jgi:hypothetical protein
MTNEVETGLTNLKAGSGKETELITECETPMAALATDIDRLIELTRGGQNPVLTAAVAKTKTDYEQMTTPLVPQYGKVVIKGGKVVIKGETTSE